MNNFKVGDTLKRVRNMANVANKTHRPYEGKVTAVQGDSVFFGDSSYPFYHDNYELVEAEPKKLSDLKEGDWVWTIQRGWVKVQGINQTHCFPIKAEGFTYTLAGTINGEDLHPSLYTYDPINGSEPSEPKIDWNKVPMGTWINIQLSQEREAISCIFTTSNRLTISHLTQDGLGISQTCKSLVTIDESKNPIRPEWYKDV